VSRPVAGEEDRILLLESCVYCSDDERLFFWSESIQHIVKMAEIWSCKMVLLLKRSSHPLSHVRNSTAKDISIPCQL
jgi:hypothetical protein